MGRWVKVGGMIAKKLTKQQLIEALRDITESIANDDSFEGGFEYSCLSEDCAKGEFMVAASWRVGNSQGQGGYNLIGNHP